MSNETGVVQQSSVILQQTPCNVQLTLHILQRISWIVQRNRAVQNSGENHFSMTAPYLRYTTKSYSASLSG